MPSALPPGDPVPFDGSLPMQAASGSATRKFGVYVHVPYCRVRCGYCDFNTYTAVDLGTTNRSSYAGEAMAEMRFAGEVLDRAGVAGRQASTVFFEGGTPTLLPCQSRQRSWPT